MRGTANKEYSNIKIVLADIDSLRTMAVDLVSQRDYSR